MIHYTHEISAGTHPAATSIPDMLRCWEGADGIVTFDVSDVQSVPLDEKLILSSPQYGSLQYTFAGYAGYKADGQ